MILILHSVMLLLLSNIVELVLKDGSVGHKTAACVPKRQVVFGDRSNHNAI